MAYINIMALLLSYGLCSNIKSELIKVMWYTEIDQIIYGAMFLAC